MKARIFLQISSKMGWSFGHWRGMICKSVVTSIILFPWNVGEIRFARHQRLASVNNPHFASLLSGDWWSSCINNCDTYIARVMVGHWSCCLLQDVSRRQPPGNVFCTGLCSKQYPITYDLELQPEMWIVNFPGPDRSYSDDWPVPSSLMWWNQASSGFQN